MKIFRDSLSLWIPLLLVMTMIPAAHSKLLLTQTQTPKMSLKTSSKKSELDGLMMRALGDVLKSKLRRSPQPRNLTMAETTLLSTDKMGVTNRKLNNPHPSKQTFQGTVNHGNSKESLRRRLNSHINPTQRGTGKRARNQPMWDSGESKNLEKIEMRERQRQRKLLKQKRSLEDDFEDSTKEDGLENSEGGQGEFFEMSDDLQQKRSEHHDEMEERAHKEMLEEQEDMFRLKDEDDPEQDITVPVGVAKAEDSSKLYLSSFPRIMSVVSTITTLFNLYTDVIPDEIAQSDLLEKTEQGLKTYQKGKDFFNIIINESDEYKEEVDRFFLNSSKTLVTLEEMMKIMSLDGYYENVKGKVDTTESQFVKLENQLKFEVNDFVDKFRYFLVAIDSLRNISNYMYVEMKPFDDKYLGNSVLNVLDKIDQGVSMVDAILQLKMKAEGLLTHLTDGVSKINVVRNNMVAIIREMHKLIPVTSDSIGGVGVWGVGWALALLIAAFFWRE